MSDNPFGDKTIEEVVEAEFSEIRRSGTEIDVRRRLAFLESEDTVERLDADFMEQKREDYLQRLDHLFLYLSAERKRTDIPEFTVDDLAGTMVESKLLDGFPEIGGQVQTKYLQVSKHVENQLHPGFLTYQVISAYSPDTAADEMAEATVNYLLEQVETGEISIHDISPETIREAVRNTYSEEEYREMIEDLSPGGRNIFTQQKPDIEKLIQNSGLEESSAEEISGLYSRNTWKFSMKFNGTLLEVMPSPAPGEIYGR